MVLMISRSLYHGLNCGLNREILYDWRTEAGNLENYLDNWKSVLDELQELTKIFKKIGWKLYYTTNKLDDCLQKNNA